MNLFNFDFWCAFCITYCERHGIKNVLTNPKQKDFLKNILIDIQHIQFLIDIYEF